MFEILWQAMHDWADGTDDSGFFAAAPIPDPPNVDWCEIRAVQLQGAARPVRWQRATAAVRGVVHIDQNGTALPSDCWSPVPLEPGNGDADRIMEAGLGTAAAWSKRLLSEAFGMSQRQHILLRHLAFR